ncbi:hypothetical protein E2C01_084833 [Portunus trituberculatus]|uniref:Uncharacterized protein n=1 Tax=Portunus trituberculatus TaxID=210409 RepID=A0A5B7IWD3_PORTR|nr:hypothetical protein [Portunus trituberculatus]
MIKEGSSGDVIKEKPPCTSGGCTIDSSRRHFVVRQTQQILEAFLGMTDGHIGAVLRPPSLPCYTRTTSVI